MDVAARGLKEGLDGCAVAPDKAFEQLFGVLWEALLGSSIASTPSVGTAVSTKSLASLIVQEL